MQAYLADRDAPCPVCGYNMRGLATSTCPECGRRIELRLRRRRPSLAKRFVWLNSIVLGGITLVLAPLSAKSLWSGWRTGFYLRGIGKVTNSPILLALVEHVGAIALWAGVAISACGLFSLARSIGRADGGAGRRWVLPLLAVDLLLVLTALAWWSLT